METKAKKQTSPSSSTSFTSAAKHPSGHSMDYLARMAVEGRPVQTRHTYAGSAPD